MLFVGAPVRFSLVTELDVTSRGEGGFGSTDVKKQRIEEGEETARPVNQGA